MRLSYLIRHVPIVAVFLLWGSACGRVSYEPLFRGRPGNDLDATVQPDTTVGPPGDAGPSDASAGDSSMDSGSGDGGSGDAGSGDAGSGDSSMDGGPGDGGSDGGGSGDGGSGDGGSDGGGGGMDSGSGDGGSGMDGGMMMFSSISDFVWDDTNEDGIQDGGETGIDNVTVTLSTCTGTMLATTTTDMSGNYGFVGLLPGSYKLTFSDLPANYIFSAKDQGADDTVDSDADPSDGETDCVSLGLGEHNTDLDAGAYLETATIGNFVWDDANEDGIQDGGETGIDNVTVTLSTCAGSLVASTTTNPSGAYSFTGIAPGSYKLTFSDLPANYVFSPKDQGSDDALDSDADPSDGETDCFTANAGGTDNTVDAAAYFDGAIYGNYVWQDDNEDGIQDGGESGVPGITVELLSCAGAVLDSRTTNAQGNFSFTNLAPASYKLRFSDLPTDYIFTIADATSDSNDSDANVSTGETPCTTLSMGESDQTWDAGIYLPNAAVGDFVWDDTNEDGIQDGGELGISGVTVTLKTCAGATVGTDTTDIAGAYDFTGIAPGDYKLEFTTLPANYIWSPQDQGMDDGADSDVNTATNETACTTLSSAETDNSWDAGAHVETATIGNFVWDDENEDGIQDGGESGIDNVTVTLSTCAGSMVASTTTNPSGAYSFSSVSPGSYKLTFSGLPANYVFSPKDQGADDALDSDADPSDGETDCFTANAGGTDNTVDAAAYFDGAIYGNYVWEDDNEDGIQDTGESGVQGITVELLSCAGAVLDSRTTNSQGKYNFTNLTPGSYKLRFSNLPADYVFTIQDATAENKDSDANVSTGETACTTLSMGETDRKWDAGIYLPKAAIGDFVWNDANEDGIQDGGELGISGVTVTLKTCAGATVGTDTTDMAGAYNFAGITPGDYKLEFTTLPANYIWSPQDQGMDDGADSDVNTATNETACTTLSSAETDNSWDAGAYLQTASIGDYVWDDQDEDGIQDGGEPSLAGVTVTLRTCTNIPLQSTTTNAMGQYSFTNLTPGNYKVTFSGLPTGYIWTTQDAGGDDSLDSDVLSNGFGSCISLTGGENNTDMDAGAYIEKASIGGRTWSDADEDGIEDGSEIAESGVTVELYNCLGGLVNSTTTDGTGAYSFTDVTPNDYYIKFAILPANHILSPQDQGGDDTVDSDPNTSTGQTACTTLSPGESETDWDAGMYEPKATIGGRIWNDVDGDGIQDGGEVFGFSGRSVVLTNCAGTPLAATTTNSSGEYSFTGVLPGSFRILFSGLPPTGYNISPQDAGGDDSADSDGATSGTVGQTACFSVTYGEVADTWDQGLEPQTATLGNFVWQDDDMDGIQDGSEVGIPGVTVELYDCSSSLQTSTTTDGTGYYNFFGLAVGSYVVKFILPTNYTFTTESAGGSNQFNDSNANTTTGESPCTALTAGEANNDIDAGMIGAPSTISGIGWVDDDRDGIRDGGESGIVFGNTVRLMTCLSTSSLQTTTLDGSGNYSFSGVNPGDYRVQIDQPFSNYIYSPKDQGSDDTVDSDVNTSNGRTDCFTVSPASTHTNVDGGIISLNMTVTGRAWLDTNKDGIEDPGETSNVSGVQVNLLPCPGVSGSDSATTNSSGTYALQRYDGDWRLQFYYSGSGLVFSPQDQGSDDTVDSDPGAAVTLWTSSCMTFAAGSHTHWDVGLHSP